MNIDICVLSETKKKGRGTETAGEYIHMCSGVSKDARAKRGVSVAIHKKSKKIYQNLGENRGADSDCGSNKHRH